MPRFFVSPTFFVTDWYRYGLAEPGHGRNWVRYYDDAVLIDERGYVYDTAPDLDWEGYGPDHDEEYETSRRAGPYPPAVYYAPVGATTTVIVQSTPVVTTTTTTYVDEEIVHVRPKAGKTRRAWRARPKCVCK